MCQYPTAEPDEWPWDTNSHFSVGAGRIICCRWAHTSVMCVYPCEEHICVPLKLISTIAANFQLGFPKFVVTSVNQAGPEQNSGDALSALSFQNRMWVQQRHSEELTGLYFSLSQLTGSCKEGFTSRQTLLSFRASLHFGNAWEHILDQAKTQKSQLFILQSNVALICFQLANIHHFWSTLLLKITLL